MSSIELHCIIDRSGSMGEYGKPMLLVNLLRYVRQFSGQHSLITRYLSWGQQITETNWSAELDVELPEANNICDASDLLSWRADNPRAVLLVLTDGYFELSSDQRQKFEFFDDIYVVAVGGDADLARLKTLSSNSCSAEQLDQALYSILRSQTESTTPVSRVDLPSIALASQETVSGSEDDDDEW